MPKLVQVLAGRLYDAAFEAGDKHGFHRGVEKCAIKREEINKVCYSEGVKDANHFGQAAFQVAMCNAMRRRYKWGQKRLNRLRDETAKELMDMIDPAEAVRALHKLGVHIEYDYMLMGELEGDL